jgi:disulfide bond formation protein DsbB
MKNFFGFGICLIVLISSMYIQHYMGIEPCSLCLIQRSIFCFSALFFLFSALYFPCFGAHRFYAFITFFLSFVGALLSSWHLYIQSTRGSQEFFECTPGLGYVVDFLSLKDILLSLSKNTDGCSKVELKIFLISIPGWSLTAFLMLLFLSLNLIFSTKKPFLFKHQ